MPTDAELQQEQDDDYSYVPPFLYETITYTGGIQPSFISAPGGLGNNKVTDWRTPFHEVDAECLPNTQWFNAGTTPTMFERITLGGAFQMPDSLPRDAWVFRPARNGMYRLKFRCGYYATRKIGVGKTQVEPLLYPVSFCLYMMRTSVGGLSTMTLADIDMSKLGTGDCQQKLLSKTPWWVACYKDAAGTVVAGPTDSLPYVEILARLSVGEEIMPCVGFLATRAVGDFFCDPSLTWPQVLGTVAAPVLQLSNNQAIIKTTEVPCYTTDTSFGYELLD